MTDKIIFRELDRGDVGCLYNIYSDREAMKYRGSKPMETVEDAKKFVENRRIVEDQTITVRQGVQLVKTEELVGSVMYRFDKNRKAECEIGYSIGRKFWGKGLGKEIVKILLKALEEKNIVKVAIAWCNKENIASIKILEQMGFQRVSEDEDENNYLYRRKVG